MPVEKTVLTRPYPLAWTITDNGNALANSWCTLYDKSNNGAVREKTNSQGKIIFSLDNLKRNNQTTGYSNGDVLQLVVGGIETQNKILVRKI